MTDSPAAQPPTQHSEPVIPSMPASPDADITLSTTDIVDFTPEPAARKRRRTTIVSAVAAVLVAVAGVGAYAGVRAWTGSGIVEPESAMPAGTAAFLRVDLKPGYRDQIAFDSLAKKFPGRGDSTSDLVTRIERKMLEGSGLNYDSDVAPWFGQRAGVGAYAAEADHVTGLIALASTDDGKAKETLSKVVAAHPGRFGFVVRDGYALLAVGGTNPQSTAEAASNSAKTANLAADNAFRTTVAHLPGNNLVVGYADLSKVGPLLGNALSGAMALGGLPSGAGLTGAGVPGAGLPGGLGLLPGLGAVGGASSTDALAKATGHVAIGAGVADDGVEVHVHSDGAATSTPADTVDAKATLDAMPDSAVVGMATRGMSAGSPSLKQLDSMLGRLASGPDGMGGAATAQLSAMVKSVLTAKVISIGFGGMSNGMPNLILAVDTGDSAAAAKLNQGAGILAGVPGVHVNTDGTTVRATIGEGLTGGKLGDTALYQEALKGAGNSSMVAFVDVQKLMHVVSAGGSAAAPKDGTAPMQNLAPVKAIGISSTASGTSTDVLIRIVIK